MENVHKTADRPWIASRINIKEFRDNYFAGLSSMKSSTKEVFKLNAREYAELEEECGLSAMKHSLQHTMEISKELIIPENVDLETLKLQKEDLERRQEDNHYERLVYTYSKFCNYPAQKIVGYENKTASTVDFVPVTQPDVLLYVQIFRPELRPINNSLYGHTSIRQSNFQVDQEFLILGSQYLTDLRDKIDCVSDRAIPGDCSDIPLLTPEMTCKDLYHSGFFYIDGVFYNDMRDPDCRDYSELIINWTKSGNRGIGPFQKSLMETTKFEDLNIQLGYPYVYVHQGHCEHLIVFSDLLMHSQHHSNNRNDFPVPVSLKPKKRVLCMICHAHVANWIVYDNKRVPENPFFFCKLCFFSYNYDEEGQKIGEFRAYHHIDRSTIV